MQHSMKATTQEERHQIAKMIEQGMTSKEIGIELGLSKKTIDKWRCRIRSSGTESKMGRPFCGPMGNSGDAIQLRVKALRLEHPSWGGKMIHCELNQLGDEPPSPITIYRYMKQQGLIKGNERHQMQTTFPKIEAKEPHDVWQIDGQGNEKVNGLGTYAIVNAKDVFSGLHVGVHPVHMRSERGHPATRHYQATFRHAAMIFGLPRQVQTDHASVFYDNHTKSPFPTLFFMWLVALDVKPVFSRIHLPQDQGKVERSHQTMWAQIDRRTPYKTHDQFFDYCQKRRTFLNEKFPSSACDNQPPLTAYPDAAHSGRHYSPEIEQRLCSIDRVYDYLENEQWWRKVSKDSTISIGGRVYYLKDAKPNAQVKIQFRKSDTSLLITIVNELCFKCKIKGLDISDLIGERDFPFPGVQLKLPLFDC